jgi:hypothetical protein
MAKNISTAFKFNERDAKISEHLLMYEDQPNPEAIHYFTKHCDELTNYGYWFLLSTLWVWAGDVNADLNFWRKLFSSNRPDKEISLMKPDELKELKSLPNKLTVYRAPASNETDGISYTTDLATVIGFAKRHKSKFIFTGHIKKHDITALFLRRDESELLILDQNLIHGLKKLSITSVNLEVE